MIGPSSVDSDDLIPPSLRAGPEFEAQDNGRNRSGGGFNYVYGENYFCLID